MKKVLFVLGFALLLGTAGASDSEIIPFTQILLQCAIGIVLLCIGGTALKEETNND